MKPIPVAGWVAMGILTLFGAWLRLAHLTTYPTWWDEHASLFSAAGQVARQGDAWEGRVSSAASSEAKVSPAQEGDVVRVERVRALCRAGNVPAATLFWDRGNGLAFNFLLHGWLRVFGTSDAALRALPWTLGTLALPLIFWVAWQCGGGLPGAIVSTALLAANALLIEYSREVRPYALVVVLSLAATSCLLSLPKHPRHWGILVGYALCMLALTFTHYLAVPVIFGSHILAAMFSTSRWRVLGAVGLASVLSASALALWMSWGGRLGMAAMAEHDRIWLERAHAGIVWWLQPFHWPDAIRLTIERTLQMNWPGILFWPREHPIMGAGVVIWAAAALYGLVNWWWRDWASRSFPAILILAVSSGALFSLLLSWKSGHTLPFLNRYFIVYVPFQCLLLGLAFAGVWDALQTRRWRAANGAVAAVLTLANLAMLRANLIAATHPKPKETFSFDQAVKEVPPGAKVRCDSLDSALVFALKASPEHFPGTVQVNPSLNKKLEWTQP